MLWTDNGYVLRKALEFEVDGQNKEMEAEKDMEGAD